MKKTICVALSLLAAPTVALAHGNGPTPPPGVGQHAKADRRDDWRDEARIQDLLSRIDSVYRRRAYHVIPSIDAELSNLLREEQRESHQELREGRGNGRDARAEAQRLRRLGNLRMRLSRIQGRADVRSVRQRRDIAEDLLQMAKNERVQNHFRPRGA